MSTAAAIIQRHHHITLCVGDAQEDYDFHTKPLSLKSVKKTALYDGTVPIYHLYYGHDHGDESTLTTSFPMRQSGRKGRPGSGQIGTAGDARLPYSNGELPAELAIRSTHTITVNVRELEPAQEFMDLGWSGREVARDGKFVRYALGDGGPGEFVDFALEANMPQASWTFGEGVVHHCAFQVENYDAQDAIKAQLEGLGFTDTSERKDRGYFESIYVRTPGGAMFEATVSKPTGFIIDEPYESLGKNFQVPPAFAPRSAEILAFLSPLKY